MEPSLKLVEPVMKGLAFNVLCFVYASLQTLQNIALPLYSSHSLPDFHADLKFLKSDDEQGPDSDYPEPEASTKGL